MTVSRQAAAAPADWYADPAGHPHQRWWNGVQWTEHTRPAMPMIPSPAKRRSGLYNAEVDLANGNNSPARMALVLGGLSLLFNPCLLFSIGAIAWGSIGLGRADSYASRGFSPIGRTHAVCGLVLGVFGLLATAILKGFLF